MSKGRSIVKNTGAMLLATLIRMSASFVLVIFVARNLGSTGMGEFSLILSLFWIFQTIASMGVQPLIIREIAKAKDKTGIIFSNAAFLAVCASALMSVCMIGFTVLAEYSRTIHLASCWMSMTLILSTISILIQAIFIAWEKAEFVMLGITWESGIRLGAGIFILVMGRGLVVLSSIFALSTAVSLIINTALMRKHVSHFPFRLEWPVCKWLMKMVPTFAGISITNTVFWHVGTVLMSKLTTMEAIGLFSASMRIVTMVKLILQSYKVAIQPVAVQTFHESIKSFKSFCEQSLKYVFILTIPICAGVLVLSEQILLFIFGPEFVASANIFRIQVFILLTYGVTLVLASFLIASHNQKTDLRINSICMVIQIVLGFIFISKYGILGAALSLLLSMQVFMAQQLLFIQRNCFKLDILGSTLKIIAASCGMAGVAWILSSIHIVMNIVLSAATYAGLLFLLGIMDMQDIRRLILMRKDGH